ncbi:aldehyde dehydrogenase family protein [Bacillus smithii]|uniref:aldehyde dehydrogenase family protein n=1 Tax=Bacillus smithii TaxID=1479 RepID=UPI003D1F84F8
MASVASKLKVGPGLKKDTQISALVSAKPYETVRDYLETRKEKEAKPITGESLKKVQDILFHQPFLPM